MAIDPPTSSSNSLPPGARLEVGRPDVRPLHEGLERLREFVHERLDRIESMVHEQGHDHDHEPSQRERELRQRIAELEERQTRLVTEARRMEQEWRVGMEQIEHDRRLLAEAWDRLERERIDGSRHASDHARPIANSAPSPAPAPTPPPSPLQAPPVPPMFRPAVTPQPSDGDVVTHAVLKQFQALRSDVRRNANGRNHR